MRLLVKFLLPLFFISPIICFSNPIDRLIKKLDNDYYSNCKYVKLGFCLKTNTIGFSIFNNKNTDKIIETVKSIDHANINNSSDNSWYYASIAHDDWPRLKIELQKLSETIDRDSFKNLTAEDYFRNEKYSNSWIQSCPKPTLDSDSRIKLIMKENEKYPNIKTANFQGYEGEKVAYCSLASTSESSQTFIYLSEWKFSKYFSVDTNQIQIEFINKDQSNPNKLLLKCTGGSNKYRITKDKLIYSLRSIGIEMSCH